MNRRSTQLDVHQNSQAGFSIMEVVIVIALFIVLLLGLLSVYDWQQRVYNLEMANIAATGGARTIMNNFSEDIPQAVTVVNSYAFAAGTYTSGGNGLVVQLPVVDSSGNLVSDQYDYVAYYLDGSRLMKLTQAHASSQRNSGLRELSANVQTLNLAYNNGDPAQASTVAIDLTTSAVVRGASEATTSLSETFFLRNK